jgi:hypothetical protein
MQSEKNRHYCFIYRIFMNRQNQTTIIEVRIMTTSGVGVMQGHERGFEMLEMSSGAVQSMLMMCAFDEMLTTFKKKTLSQVPVAHSCNSIVVRSHPGQINSL